MEDRKARLAALAAKAGRNASEPKTAESTAPSSDAPSLDAKQIIHFRNYIPSDPKLLSGTQPSSVDGDESMHASTKRSRMSGPADPTSKLQDKSVLEAALEKARSEISKTVALDSQKDGPKALQEGSALMASADLGLATQKKKINEDLKRQIQPKLDRLQKRTQKAIVSLLRERLEKEAASSELD